MGRLTTALSVLLLVTLGITAFFSHQWRTAVENLSEAEARADHNAEQARQLSKELDRRDEIVKQLEDWKRDNEASFNTLRANIHQDLEEQSEAFRACLEQPVDTDLLDSLRSGANADRNGAD